MAAAEPGELAAAREKILRATLIHVPFNGWSVTALEHGIRDSGVEGAPARLAFQGGMAEVAEYYSRFADERMLAALDNDAVVKMPIRARITQVVRLRLEQAETEREAVRSLMSWLALPGNQALGAKCLYRAVDAMWHEAGDTSTDFNFYSKRAMLAGILAATVLYWLVDDSEGREATWVFLDRRVDDVLGIEKAKARVRGALSKLPDPFNILKRGFPGDRPPGA